jgi:hypothetical protein
LRAAFLEARLNELSASLDEKDRMLALDKDFLAHDREIRDLIAARNLYITDIFDVKDNGQTAKPFGRIFYTKDKSLVFYGYDLDKQAGHKESVAFQAWGSGDAQPDVSLGLFYQDGTQKRWVLRFNDTKTLARLNIRGTISSTASGVASVGQFGTPQEHFFLLDGHDANLSWLGAFCVSTGCYLIRRSTRRLRAARWSSRSTAAG